MRRFPMVCVGGALDGEHWLVEGAPGKRIKVPTREPHQPAGLSVSCETIEFTTTYYEYEVAAIHSSPPSGEVLAFFFLKPIGSHDPAAIELLLKHYPGAPRSKV